MWFHIDTKEVLDLSKALTSAGKNAEAVVNQVLHEEAGQKIQDNIMLLLPESGRNWKGKRRAARKSEPFRKEKANLAIIVKTKSYYNYLYFPDDGSNTERHAGNQQFMLRGAENAAPDIIRLCTAKIIEEIGG